jgi:hypothetical protein
MRPHTIYITTYFHHYVVRPFLWIVGLAVVGILAAAATLYILSFPPFRWLL